MSLVFSASSRSKSYASNEPARIYILHFALKTPHHPALFLVFNRHMKRILFFASIVSIFLAGGFSVSVYAQKASAKSTLLVVNKATVQNIISISGKEPTETERAINITWKSATPPQAIFYRPDAAHWLKCRALRSEKRPFGGGPNDFMVVEVNTALQNIKSGDVITLRPEHHPSEVQPGAVKSMPAGALFIQLKGAKSWQVVKVNVTKLPDQKHP
jgi:hypothetical protein